MISFDAGAEEGGAEIVCISVRMNASCSQELRMPKYNVNASVVGGKFIGEYEADSAEEAVEKASRDAHVSLCHQCARDVDDLQIEDLTAELTE